MRASQAMHMFIKIHHLEPIKLIGNRLDLLLFILWNRFDARCIPFYICARSFFVLAAGFYGATGDGAVVDVLDSVGA